MPENIKKLFSNNLGLKASALILAVLVWASISGRERKFSEKTLKVPVEIFNVSENMEVVSLRPEEVTVSLKGASKFVTAPLRKSTLSRSICKISRKAASSIISPRITWKFPPNVQFISIHPKMIEVYVEEFATREVPVKIRFRGRLKPPLVLKEARVIPDRVTVMGYKSQINDIKLVMTEAVDLSEIGQSLSRRVALKQTRDILKFRDRRDVELQLEIEDRSAKK